MANQQHPTNPGAPRTGAGPAGQEGHGQHAQGQGGVKDTLRQAASSVGDIAGQAREKVSDLASGAADRLEGAWEGTKRGVREGAHYVADTAEDFWTGTQNLIRRYPIASVMVAFGLGCLCSMLMSGPRWSSDMANRMSRSSM
jgi:hypothetical protein